MGLSNGDFETLLALFREGRLPRGARIADLGQQDINADLSGALLAMAKREFALDTDFPPSGQASDLWLWLGLQPWSFDIAGSKAVPLDLNFDEVPADLRGTFHVVTNLGTTEHVMNQANAFKVIHDLTGRGGLMLHNLPSVGFIDHGLVTYPPKFFWRLARANGYSVVTFQYVGDAQKITPSHDIREFFTRFDPKYERKRPQIEQPNLALLVVLRKDSDLPFAPSIDLPDEAPPPDDLTRARYWSQFDQGAFTRT